MSLSIEELAKKLEKIESVVIPLQNENDHLKKQTANLTYENELMKKDIEDLKKRLSLLEQSKTKPSSVKTKEVTSRKQDSQIQNEKVSSPEKKKKKLTSQEKNKTIEGFNSFPVKTQQTVISELITNTQIQNYSKFDNLLQYLLKFNKAASSTDCIEIPTNNPDGLLENLKENDQELNSIKILSKATEILYRNKSLNLESFAKLLLPFDYVSIEVKYPSESFQKVFDMVVEIKNNKVGKLIIGIFISGIRETDETFKNNRFIDYVRIDSSVSLIGKDAFCECPSLSQVIISSSVKSIEAYAFSGCSSLTHISIPSSVVSIESYAFSGCLSLTKITIPSSVTSIGECAFTGCSSLTQISIPSSVKSIGNFAFEKCSALKQIEIPSSVTAIGGFSFSGCTALKKISIPTSVTSIGYSAFSGCSSLAQITIPSSVVSIGNFAFEKCSSLSQISLPSSVESVGISAFPTDTKVIRE